MAFMQKEFQIILFNVGTVIYAIPIENVFYIEKYMTPTTIPNSPAFVEGIINLRGNVIPVIDLRKRFGIKDAQITNKTKIIIVGLENRKFGFIVDSVSEVVTLKPEEIEPTLPTVSGLKSEFIYGIGKIKEKLVIILNIEKILFADKNEEIVGR
ncbi:MAG: chemotaxis protein CheW [Spirochaetes bacterium]|nr:chemotaxis protein CheW [Spirochaetota bacterium]